MVKTIKITSISHKPQYPKVGEKVTITVFWKHYNAYYGASRVYDKIEVEYGGKTEVISTGVIVSGVEAGVDYNITFDTAGQKDIVFKAYMKEICGDECDAEWVLTDSKTYTIIVTNKTVTLEITTTPSEANIYIDGNYIGTT